MDGERLHRWDSLAGRARSRRETIATALALAVAGRLRVGAALAQGGTPCPETTPEEAIRIGRAYFDAFNSGDADALDALLAPDYRHQGALVDPQDRELHKQRMLDVLIGFPDGHYDVEDVIAEGDLVAIRHVFTGTNTGPFLGRPGSGAEAAVRAIHIHRIACGQIVETWNSGDALGLLRQIGALPGGEAARSPVGANVASPAAATPGADCPATTAEQNAEMARRWTEEALDGHDLSVLEEFVNADIVHHAGVFEDELGRDVLQRDLQALLDGFPDSRWTADLIVAQDDRVAVRWTGRGTHTGEFLGAAPTGRSIVFPGINWYRFACGEIVEGWSEPDSLGLLRQIGLLPPADTPAATPASS